MNCFMFCFEAIHFSVSRISVLLPTDNPPPEFFRDVSTLGYLNWTNLTSLYFPLENTKTFRNPHFPEVICKGLGSEGNRIGSNLIFSSLTSFNDSS